MGNRVLLIAGHGQGDPGAVSKWGQEADLTRDLAKKIFTQIRPSFLEAELYDVTKDCYQQTKKGLGPDYGAYDFILEIHFNAKTNKDENGDGRFTGTGGYVQEGADAALAEAILTGIVSLGFKKWCLCRTQELCNCNAAWRAGTPYFLLETAFLDDGDDMEFYNRKKDAFAKTIASVLEKKLGKTEQSQKTDALYRVQCGAFQNKTNAENLKRQLEKSGFSAIITVEKRKQE